MRNLRYLNAERCKIELGDRFKESAERIKNDIEAKDTTSPFEIVDEFKKVATGVLEYTATQRVLRDINGYEWCSVDSLKDDKDWVAEDAEDAQELGIHPLNTVTDSQLLASVLDEISETDAINEADDVMGISMMLTQALERYLGAAKERVNDRYHEILEDDERPYGELEKMKDLRGSVKLETELEHISVELEKIARLSKELEAVNRKIEGIETEKLLVLAPVEPEQ